MPSLSLANNTFKACRLVPPFSLRGFARELLSIVVVLFHVRFSYSFGYPTGIMHKGT